MNKIDYQALRAKVERVTYGGWSPEYGGGRFDGGDALIHHEATKYVLICRIEGVHPESGFDEDFQIEQQANAGFVVATNPAAILTLLDGRGGSQQYIKRRDQEDEDTALTVRKLHVKLETAEKRISELKAQEVMLPSTQDVHPLGPQSAKVFYESHRNIINRCTDETHKAGVNVSIRGK